MKKTFGDSSVRPIIQTPFCYHGLLLLSLLWDFSISRVNDFVTNQPIVIGRRFFSMCSLFFILFSSLVFLPLFRSEYLGSCILFGLMRSAIICTQTVGHSPLKKISHDIFRTRLVCLTFVAERAFIGMLLPITTCAQGVLDIVFLGVTCDDICLISPSCSFYC